MKWGVMTAWALLLLLTGSGGARPQAKALTRGQIEGLVKGGVDSHRIAMLVERRGLDFEPTEDFLGALRKAGAQAVLIEALRSARRPRPPAPAPPAPAAAKPAPPESPPPPATAPEHIARGREFELKHDLRGAIAEYRQALAISPKDAETQYKLGTLLYAQGELPGAVDALAAAARLAPDRPDIALKLGLARYVSGDLDGSIAAYRQAIRLRPNDAEAHNALGDALLKKGDRLAALEEYRRAFELAPNSSTFPSAYPQILQELRRSAAARPAPPGSP